MTTDSARRAATAITDMLARGIIQGEDTLDYVRSAHGGDSPEDFEAVLSDHDGPDARSLCSLLLFPGEAQLAALEPVFEEAACTPEDARKAATMVELEVNRTRAILPGGVSIDIPLDPGDVAALVIRLRLDHTPPQLLSRGIDERFTPETASRIKSRLRHSRLDWTGQRIFFLAALFGGLDPARADLDEVLSWALTWLSSLPPDAVAAERLGAKHGELTARLRRSADFHAELSKTSYELMMAQGARVSLPHPDEVRRELALLDAVCMAVAGRPGWALEGVMEVDLGQIEDEESLIRALGGP